MLWITILQSSWRISKMRQAKTMKRMNLRLLLLFLILELLSSPMIGQELCTADDYFLLNAGAEDPVYTSYAATISRSTLYGDKAYKMVYYDDSEPIYYQSDKAGRHYGIWVVNDIAITETREFFKRPVVKYSFPDMAVLEYMPFEGVKVQETFLVYSSSVALVDINIWNEGARQLDFAYYPIYELGNDSLEILDYDTNAKCYVTSRGESLYRLISSLHARGDYPTSYRETFSLADGAKSFGGYKGNKQDFYLEIKTDHYADDRYNDKLNEAKNGLVDFIALQSKFSLEPGESTKVRYVRGVQAADGNIEGLKQDLIVANELSIQSHLEANESLFADLPKIALKTPGEKMIYLGAINLARTCMLPPTGETAFNYYVFSRNPIWGWGHGHQVLHESLAMIAYVYLDPVSAQGSQRVYMEQQGDDGLIAYRHGPRGMQDYPHYSKVLKRDMSTTSAPFYSWINWEIYQVSQDKVFLEAAYQSGVKYTNWLITNRDLDQDGTFEWGPYGIIENVRDWYNAVFQVSSERYLDVDKEDISDELECLDLTVMMVNEMRSLSKMAIELGKVRDAKKWEMLADKTSVLVNERMWDEETEFYYSVNKDDHSFNYLTRDLRRPEIIGFLTLWANVATPKRAKSIVDNYLLNPDKFWRKYGVPTLAADDEWYSPDVDYCCKWNGPVWLLWNYMVYAGLRNYGFDKEASELAGKMTLAVETQLKKNHNFWESYSPDNEVLNSPSNYIWDAIMARILIDEYTKHNFE